MNDEIKEILLIIKSCKQDYDKQKDGMHTFDYGELYLLYDYITNLQQAVKDTKDTADDMLFELKQENERLKEENNNKAMNDYAHAIDESWYRELYDDYKSRCEKAIEQAKEKIKRYESYINDLKKGNYPSSTIRQEKQELIFRIREQEDLLNILQNGSDSQ